MIPVAFVPPLLPSNVPPRDSPMPASPIRPGGSTPLKDAGPDVLPLNPPLAPASPSGGAPTPGQVLDLTDAVGGALNDIWDLLNGVFRPLPDYNPFGDTVVPLGDDWWQGEDAEYKVEYDLVYDSTNNINECSRRTRGPEYKYVNRVLGARGVRAFLGGGSVTYCGGSRYLDYSIDSGAALDQSAAGGHLKDSGGSTGYFEPVEVSNVRITCQANCNGVVPLEWDLPEFPELDPLPDRNLPPTPLPTPLPVAPPIPLPQPEEVPQPEPSPSAPPIAPPSPGAPSAPPATPSPGRSPGTLPGVPFLPGTDPGTGDSPTTDPGTDPDPSQVPAPLPFPPGIPGVDPSLPPTGETPIPLPPVPVPTTPPGQEQTPDGPIGQPGTEVRPQLEAIAAELGRQEQKMLQLLRRPDPGLDLTDILLLLAQLLELLNAVYPPGSYELSTPCLTTGPGSAAQPQTVSWQGGLGRFQELNLKIDALAALVAEHKKLKGPACLNKNPPVGQPVTVQFEEE